MSILYTDCTKPPLPPGWPNGQTRYVALRHMRFLLIPTPGAFMQVAGSFGDHLVMIMVMTRPECLSSTHINQQSNQT